MQENHNKYNPISDLISKNKALALYFSGSSCGACEVLSPKIEKLFKEEFPKINYLSKPAQSEKVFLSQYGIYVFPTIIIFFDGKEYYRKSQFMGIQEIRQALTRTYRLYFN